MGAHKHTPSAALFRSRSRALCVFRYEAHRGKIGLRGCARLGDYFQRHHNLVRLKPFSTPDASQLHYCPAQLQYLFSYLRDRLSARSTQAYNNEITLLLGQTVLNSAKGENDIAMGVEYRRSVFRYMDWTVAWLNEGDTRPIGRYGVMSQLWA